VEAFAGKMLDVLNHAGLALMISLGHRTGLFDVMAQSPPASAAEIARRSKLHERYVREWLGAMTSGGIVEYDSAERTFFLPKEHAAVLTRTASPHNMAASMQWIAVLGYVEEEVLDAFSHGKGVPYSSYRRFHEVMAEESAQTVVAALMEHIVPLVEELDARLKAGIDVVDVGCGSGRALLRLAQHYPCSRFTGYDLSDEGIDAGRREAERQGLGNIQFEVRDVSLGGSPAQFDLATAFDAIHDQARPQEVLCNIAAFLRPGGVFLMQDIAGSSHLHHDLGNPAAPFLYTISCMHCMSVSLSQGGPGLGAMWGKETALSMLAKAGFADVRVESLPHDAMNYYYIARRGD
jgi:2-polyprenyl-3-methyl-5-hydroxy-6-metoxy-1,4-benzoquinol methylase